MEEYKGALQLKWSDGKSIGFFEEIYASKNHCKKMVEWEGSGCSSIKERENISPRHQQTIIPNLLKGKSDSLWCIKIYPYGFQEC